MRGFPQITSIVLAGTLSACATIISGSSQRVAVDSLPHGADCRVLQGGMPVADVRQTPGFVTLQRGSGVVQVNCTKPGYQPTQQAEGSDINGWVFGNLILGGVVGIVVDLATKAAYHYGPSVTVALDHAGYSPMAFGSYAGGPSYAAAATSNVDVTSNQQRFYAATGRPLPAAHGLIVLPSATPDGDPTYIWPNSGSN